ncbi:uncharacterized protein LOC115238965 [Formica exsecta]|uniref:uncharacterized protein LOC115238965 n=1 Tax=Formica exsecta TaxID=72781 RepID=UPI001142AE59|nr:uncharacterized protein LOC115238965 [Formica exsecta]
MKDIYLVVILYMTTLSIALNISPVTDFPTECPINDNSRDKIVYLPHENDCTKFYSCHMGTKGKPLDCPFMDKNGNRLHFNPVLQVCDWPWNAECQIRSTSTPMTPTSSLIPPISPSSSLTTISSPSPSTSPTSSSNSPTTSTVPPNSSTPPTSSSSFPTTSTLPPSSSTLPTSSSNSPTMPTVPPNSSTTVTSSSSSLTTTTLPPNSSISTTSSSNSPTTATSSPSSPTSPTSSSNFPTTPTLPSNSSTSSTSSSNSPTTTTSSPSFPTTPTLPSSSSTSPTSSSSSPTTPTLPPNSSTSSISSSSFPTTTTLSPSSPTLPTSSSSSPTTPTLPPSSSTSPILPPSSSISPTSSSSSPTTSTLPPSSSTLPTLSPSSSISPTSSSSSPTTLPSNSSTSSTLSSPLTTTILPPSSSTSPISSSSSPITMTSSSSSSISSTLPASSSTSSNIIKNTTSGTLPSWTCEFDDRTHMIPHKIMCDHYYICFNGIVNPEPKKCDRNLLFNPILRVCDYPENVNCNYIPNVVWNTTTTSSASPLSIQIISLLHPLSPTMTITAASTTITTAISMATTQASKKPRTKCPSKTSTEVARIAHRCLCNVYYECVNGDKIHQTCPNGMHFDYVREVCDLPEIVNCVRPITAIDILMGSCQSKCYPDGKAFQHEIDCSSYYLCSDGERILKHCIAGLHFNVILQMCDYPIKPDCDLTAMFLTTITVGDCPPPDSTEKVLLPHECNCEQYYECVNGNQVLRICPNSQHFDRIRNICDHPENAKCPYVCPCTKKTILLPHECNCNQYYECVKGRQALRTCPNGLYFDYIQKICKHPAEANCATTPNPTTTTETTTTETTTTETTTTEMITTETTTTETTTTETTTTETTTTETPITTTPTTTTTENIPEKPRKTCPPPGSTEEARIAHPLFCNMYYKCKNGKKILQICPITWHFDYIREVCDWFWKVKCIRPIPTYDILISDCDNKCSQEGRAFRHETDCSLYYLCSNGKKILKYCTAGLHFNVTLQMCNYPYKSCDLSDNTLSITTLNVCPPNSIEKVRFSHKCKCTHYYECVNGRNLLFECSDGLHFDNIQQICKDPVEAGCATFPESTPTSIISTTKWPEETDKTTINNLDPSTCIGTCPETDPSFAVLLPNKDCKKFCMCSSGIAWVQSCPEPLYFDSKDKVCKYKREAVCAVHSFNQDRVSIFNEMIDDENSMQPLNDKINDKQKIHDNSLSKVRIYNLDPATCIGICPEEDPTFAVLLPNEDCKKFCMCSNGIAWVQSCPEPLYFDSKDKVCKNKRDAVCAERLFNQDHTFMLHRIVDDENSVQSLHNKNNDEQEIHDNSWSKVRINDDLDPATCIGICPEEDPTFAVLLPNEDCKKFCMCSNGIAWVQSCPEPLYFDSKDKVCKNKRDAVCAKRLFNQDDAFMLHRIVDDENSVQSLHNKNNDEQEIHDNSWSKVRINDDLDPATCIGICPEEDPPFAVLLPNEDCKKFCMCSNSIAWVQSCPEPLYFDSKDKVCKNKRDAVCAKRLFNQDDAFMLHRIFDDENSMQSLHNKNNDEQEIHDNSWSKVRINDDLDPATCIGTCPEVDPPFAVLLPNEDCKKFCMCSNGYAWVQFCPVPLYFDSKDTVCKNKRDAVCAVRSFN